MKQRWQTDKLKMPGIDQIQTLSNSKGPVCAVGVGTGAFPGEEAFSGCTYDIDFLIALLKKMKKNGIEEIAISRSMHNTDTRMKFLVLRSGDLVGCMGGLRPEEKE